MVEKYSKIMAFLLVMVLSVGTFLSATVASAGTEKDYLKGVSCYKQSMIRIEGEKTIYIDPYSFDGSPKDGDIVFITHTHGDHFDVNEIKKVLKKKGTIVTTMDGESQLKEAGFKNIVTVKPGKSYKVKGIKFTTVTAYNTDKAFHPKDSGWVGYNITINKTKYYFAGDTDLTSEMKQVKTDVAFLPVGGTYTMDAKQAAKAANTFKPKVAIPIHFGDVVGTTADARNFISLLDNKIKGVVLKDLLVGVSHMTQSTIRMEGNGKVVYIDPISITGEPKDADIILISHNHGDHFSSSDINKAMKDDSTILVIPESCKADAENAGYKNIIAVEPSKDYTVDGIAIKAVPAYNTNKDFHPKDNNWVGYILNMNQTLYYFAGDTDVIPEMENFDTDVAFLPVGGTYTMDAKEAVQAANTIKPLIAVSIHFADIVGTWEDGETFVNLLEKPIIGKILKQKK